MLYIILDHLHTRCVCYSNVYNFMERDLTKVKDVPVLNFESISLKVKSLISVASKFFTKRTFQKSDSASLAIEICLGFMILV